MASSSILLDTHFNVGPIDRRIFGGFLEHLGRAVYEGVYDPGNPLSDANGFRLDVIDALKKLAMPVMRYPGGNFVSCYDWTDGVGPRDQRPRRREFAWKSIETNQFGTDEFIQWCKLAQTAPMMAVNLGTAGAKEAADLVEYCNLPVGTKWSDLRAKHGHADPYGVKLWCLGNEMDGPWQAGHVSADVYSDRAFAASAMMKGMDPTIQTVACGSSNRYMPTYMAYDRAVLDRCWDKIDFISAHTYSNNHRNETPWYLGEGTEIDRVIEDYRSLLGYVRAYKRSDKHVYLSYDEWNVWYRQRSENGSWCEAPHLLEEHYNFEDALVVAQYLNSFIRNADVVKIACLAQVVNVIAPILTSKTGVLLQTIYHPFALFSQNAAGVSLRASVTAPTYKAGARGDIPTLDASATFDQAAETASIFIVNRDADQSVTVKFDDRRIFRVISCDVMGGVDPKAANTWDAPNVVEPGKGNAPLVDGVLTMTVPGPGLVVLKVATTKR